MSAAQKSNVGLDIIRGIAALLVVLGHSRNFLGVALDADLTASIWQKALLLPTSFAQESVALFFVLSGYLVGGQVLREVATRRFGWRVYMAKRLSRLWTVLIPGIAFTLVLDSLTSRLFASIWDKLAGGSSDALSALCNTAFLQVTRCEPYGTNDSLWSLSYEFWFYVIFAAAVVAVWGVIRREWLSALIGTAVCVGTVVVFGVSLFALIPSWLLGVVLAVVHNRWKERGVPAWVPASRRRTILALTALTGAGMLASNVLSPPDWARFAMVGLACAPLILITAAHPWGRSSVTACRVAALGTVSFSLYVFHLPLVKFLVGAFSLTGGAGAVGNIVAVYGVAALAVLLCATLWIVTEKRTHIVRKAMLRAFKVNRELPHAPAVGSSATRLSDTRRH